MTDSSQHTGPAGTIPAGSAIPARQPGAFGRLGAGWLRFRDWRRTRPFWAGIFLLAAGAELLLIPLPMDSLGLIVHIGIGGISGILIGAVLMVAGLLLWFHPVQRMFYSIVAVLLAIVALVASNLGGFLIGTILGVIGGSLGFGWTPLPPDAAPRRLFRRHRPTAPADTSAGLPTPSGDEDVHDPHGALAYSDTGIEEKPDDARDVAPTAVTATQPGWGRLDPSWGAAGSGGGALGPRDARYAEAVPRGSSRYSRSAPYCQTSRNRGTVIGGNIFAILIGMLTFGLINLSPTPGPSQATDPQAAAASPSPSASPTTSPKPSASPAAGPGTSPSASAKPGASTSPTASPSPGATPTGKVPSLEIASVQSTLTASSASLTDFVYDGVVGVPTATGTIQMMQFSASSLDLSGVNLAVVQGGATITTTASSLDFKGNVVLYATQLSGNLLGIPTTLTPGNALSTILQILGQLGLSQSLTQAI
ncbi:MAG TPA: DUF6114 domain-containing protein, partial [Streptosporangiaceae bacterium]